MNKQAKLTKAGFESLKAELEDLINNKRPKLVDRLAFARTQGDLTENSDYTNAKEELDFLDGRISELEDVIKTAVIADSNGSANGGVSVGTKVTVKVGGQEHVFHIVGEWEADPSQKKISHESPLGQALLGRKKGETVEVDAPAGKIIYEIIEVK